MLLANKIILASLSTLLYGGGGGGLIGGATGLKNKSRNIGKLILDEGVLEVPVRTPLRLKRTITTSDKNTYKTTQKNEVIEGTKLPKGLVESYIYQTESSAELESNDKNFYCSSKVLKDKVVGENKEQGGDLTTDIVKSESEGDHNSCINVMGHKEYYGGKKGRGSLKILQSVESRLYGTMILSTITADNGKLTVDGVSYTLQRKYPNSADKSKFEGEIKGGTYKPAVDLTADNKDKLLMLPGNEAFDKGIEENGGFNLETKDICRNNECFGKATKAEFSNKVGNGDFGHKGGRARGRSQQPQPKTKFSMKEGSSNFDSGANDGGLFPNYSSTHHEALNGHLKLFINNSGTIE